VGLLSARSNGASGTFFNLEAQVIMVISPFNSVESLRFCNMTITSSGRLQKKESK
jgi:hypothetical protein